MAEPKPPIDPRLQQRSIELSKQAAEDWSIRADREAFLAGWRRYPRTEILKKIEWYKKKVVAQHEAGHVEGDFDSDLWRLAALESLL